MMKLMALQTLVNPLPSHLNDKELERLSRLWRYSQHHLQAMEVGGSLFEHKRQVAEAAEIHDKYYVDFVAEFAFLSLVTRSAVSCLDLLAAFLARFIDPRSVMKKNKNEADVGWWMESRRSADTIWQNLSQQYPDQCQWLAALQDDAEWQRISKVRHIMTHRETESTQVLYAHTMGLNLKTGEVTVTPHENPGAHTRFCFEGADVDTGQLIREVRDFAVVQFNGFVLTFK